MGTCQGLTLVKCMESREHSGNSAMVIDAKILNPASLVVLYGQRFDVFNGKVSQSPLHVVTVL